MTYLIANWKSQQNITQSLVWLKKMEKLIPTIPTDLKIIICPPFTDLAEFNHHLDFNKTPFFIGAQTVSPYPAGKHTGEITANMLTELVNYCIVGHSERRTDHQETNQKVTKEVGFLIRENITPIICVDKPNIKTQIKELIRAGIPLKKCIIAYEPLSAIGSGQPETREVVKNVISQITRLTNNQTPVVYGGSITPENILNYRNELGLSGFLVGSSGLKPSTFNNLIRLIK